MSTTCKASDQAFEELSHLASFVEEQLQTTLKNANRLESIILLDLIADFAVMSRKIDQLALAHASPNYED